MKKFVLLATAAALGLGLIAPAMADGGWGGGKHHGGKHGEGRGGHMMRMIDANADGVIGDDEAAALADRMFSRLDKDGNGELTLAEATTFRMKHHGGRDGHGGKGHGRWAKCWNGGGNDEAPMDGKPAPGEQGNAQPPAAPAPDQKAAEGDAPDADAGNMPPRFAAMQERMKARFAEADADKNNVVTKVEFMNAAKTRFQTADLDKDGKVTPWEFRSQQKM